MKNRVIKDTLSLLVITLCAALCLSLVYMITKDTIANAEKEERMASFKSIMPNVSFEKIDDDIITKYNEEQNNNSVLIAEAYIAKDEGGNTVGAVVSSVSHSGYGGDIVLSVGVYNNGAISGVKVTSMSETSGLGSHCLDEDWISQFKNKTAEHITYVKNGAPDDDEIDAISGATRTTKAVLEAVNNGAAFARAYIRGEAAE